MAFKRPAVRSRLSPLIGQNRLTNLVERFFCTKNNGSIINVGVAIILTFIFLEKIIKKESKNEGNPLE